MKVYKLNIKYKQGSIGAGFYGGGMAVVIANNEEECIEAMNKHWCSPLPPKKDWNKENAEITELPLTYTGAQIEPFVLADEWYND